VSIHSFGRNYRASEGMATIIEIAEDIEALATVRRVWPQKEGRGNGTLTIYQFIRKRFGIRSLKKEAFGEVL
jgi:hypothetical protein